MLPTWPRRADPKPLETRHYLDLAVSLEGGAVKVDRLTKGTFPKGARTLPRFRGRFEVRLYSHGLLRDVVRFNFPLTSASGDHPSPLTDKLSIGLSEGVTRAKTTVRIPFDERINRVLVVDTQAPAPSSKKQGKGARKPVERSVEVDLAPIRPRPLGQTPRDDLRTSSFGLGASSTKAKAKPDARTTSRDKGQGKDLESAKVLEAAKPLKRQPDKQRQPAK